MARAKKPVVIVAPRFGGAYDPEQDYEYYVFVRDGNEVYVSTQPSRGIPTSNEDYWFRFTNFASLTGDLDTVKAAITEHNKDAEAHPNINIDGGIVE